MQTMISMANIAPRETKSCWRKEETETLRGNNSSHRGNPVGDKQSSAWEKKRLGKNHCIGKKPMHNYRSSDPKAQWGKTCKGKTSSGKGSIERGARLH